jgi:tRNA-splicing ligase RtcB
MGLQKGVYLALLSHSGARGTGAEVARHYSRTAADRHPELPKELLHLAWFDLDTKDGMEYWSAMELMGKYSAANHEIIHRQVTAQLAAECIAGVENHHNFAWKERHFGEDVIVHRKGATPASLGALGVIPGSMATPGYVVRGRGDASSLCSASHGAGRRMSRKAAKERYSWADAERFLKERGVKVLSAGVDEVPMAYKDIDEVMAAQQDLVEPIAKFEPKLVKMAPAGERPED